MRSEDEETFLHGAQTKTAFRIDLEVRARRNTIRVTAADDAAMGVGDGARSAAIAGGDESLALLARARDDAPDVERGDATTRQHPERRRGLLRATTTWATHPIVVATMLTLGVCGMVAREEMLAKQSDAGAFVRVAHEIWLGSEVPGVKRMIFERNRRVLEAAGWEMRLWTEGDINERNFPITLATLERGRAFHQLTGSNVYSMLVDLMKYEVLFRHGGLYLDTNVELFKDITPLFHKTLRANKEVFMVADPGDSRFFSAGIFGALTPGASVFRSLFNDTSSDGYLQNIDFGKRCIANAITGPVWLSHIIRANDLRDTILRLDRDVAYPLGCGENEFDTCVKQVTHEDAKNDPGMRWMMNNGKAVDGSDLDGTKSSFTKYVTQTWRRVTSGNDDWNPLSLSNALVEEADGTFWKTTLPCTSIASAYPQSYAIDHFSFHGASWQDGCTNQERQAMVVEWLEKNIPADEDLVHKWALSFVRVLSSEATSSLVTRVRLHETEGVYKKARLVLASSPLRGGASLLGEALATSSNHPTSSTLWERDGQVRTDSFFANYITLGDWWSVDELPDKDDETSWRSKLRKYLQDIGVKDATIDASLTYPGEFVNEVLSRAWEAGVDKVYVSIIGAHIHSTPETSKHSEDVLSAILDAATEDPVLLCLSRENKLDMYASSMRAVNGDAPFQQIREAAEPFDAENITARDPNVTSANVRVKFIEKTFRNLIREDKRWYEATASVLRAHQRECVNLTYETDLANVDALTRTISKLHDDFDLDLNADALRLLKLERVNAFVSASDFENAGELSAHARQFLRPPPHT